MRSVIAALPFLLLASQAAPAATLGRINAILAKTFGNAPPDEMLKAMILINSLPDR